jgi:hypothetical protein
MLDFVAVFGYAPDFPGPISYTDFDTGKLIGAMSFEEAASIASEWAARHNALNRSDGCRVISVTEIELEEIEATETEEGDRLDS